MPRGDKSSYTSKQKRQAQYIEEGYEKRGVPAEEAERRAWATVNKETGGGKKSGSGRGKPTGSSAIALGQEGRCHTEAQSRSEVERAKDGAIRCTQDGTTGRPQDRAEALAAV